MLLLPPGWRHRRARRCVDGPEREARETDEGSCRGSAGSLGDGQVRGTEGGAEGLRRR